MTAVAYPIADAPAAPVAAQPSTPRVAVVIPCYAQAEFLPDTVASVCAQTFRELEIIIVDDGSPDDSVAVAQRLIDAHPHRDIRLVRQPNQGLPATRNNGIAATDAEYVLPLDADDLIGPDFVEICVAELDARPEVSIIYGSLRYFGALNEHHVPSTYDLVRLTSGNLFACTAMFRRRAWEDVGGYDERLDSYEDWDFWLGCGERGHLALLVPRPVFYYRKRPSTMLAGALGRDQQLKAQLVLNHPVLFSPEQAAWARGVLSGDADALAIDAGHCVIPSFGEPAARPTRSGGGFPGARGLALLALAEEVLEHPELLIAFTDCFTARDDATLVIAGDDEQLARLGELVSELQLDTEEAADLLGVPLPAESPGGLAAAADKVDAVLTRRVLRLPVALPRFDDARLRATRSRAMGGAPR